MYNHEEHEALRRVGDTYRDLNEWDDLKRAEQERKDKSLGRKLNAFERMGNATRTADKQNDANFRRSIGDTSSLGSDYKRQERRASVGLTGNKEMNAVERGFNRGNTRSKQNQANLARQRGEMSSLGAGYKDQEATATSASKPAPPKATPKTTTPTTPKQTTTTPTTRPPRIAQTGDKKKDMATWAKANPKLAAAQAERDRTRGTSSTTNPLMKKTFGAKHVAGMPKATPAAAAKPAKAAKPPAPAKPVTPAKPITPVKPATISSITEAVMLFEKKKKKKSGTYKKSRQPRGATQEWRVRIRQPGHGGRFEYVQANNPREARAIAQGNYGDDKVGSINSSPRKYKK